MSVQGEITLSQSEIYERLGQKDLQLFWYERKVAELLNQIAALTAHIAALDKSIKEKNGQAQAAC